MRKPRRDSPASCASRSEVTQTLSLRGGRIVDDVHVFDEVEWSPILNIPLVKVTKCAVVIFSVWEEVWALELREMRAKISVQPRKQIVSAIGFTLVVIRPSSGQPSRWRSIRGLCQQLR